MKVTGLPTDVFWSFLNEVTHQQADGLSFQQAEFIESIIPTENRGAWLVWHEGLNDWVALDECKEFGGRHNAGRMSPPLPPKRDSSIENSDASTRLQMKIDNRLNRRFVKNFAVEIIGQSATFQTKTVNLSVGGMKLYEPLPAIVGATFNAVLKRKNGLQLTLFCALLRTPKGVDETNDRIRILGAEKEGVLRSWLMDSDIE
jgi:hypothetical protein